MMDRKFKDDVLKIKQNNPNMDYIDCMIEKFEEYVDEKHKSSEFLNTLENIDERCLLVRLFGNYHYQVNNGGHNQYFDNGYASSYDYDKGFFGRKTDDLDLHKEFIRLVKKYFPCNEITTEFVNNLECFISHVQETECDCCDGSGYCYDEAECQFCNGSGFIDDESCDNCNGSGFIDDESECWNCNGDGVIHDDFDVVDGDCLDKKYYSIEESVLSVFNSVVNTWLTSDTNCELNAFNGSANSVKNDSVKAKLKLTGTDGNAFAIIGKVITALKDQKVSQETIEQYRKDVTKGDYNNLLAVSIKYCEDANIEVC
jgi:hypothetical protein